MRILGKTLRDRGLLFQWLMIAGLVLLTLVFIAFSTVRINQIIENDLRARVLDTGGQVDNLIEYRLSIYGKYVEDAAVGISNSCPSKSLAQLLEEEQATSLFDGMFIIDGDMNVVASTAHEECVRDWVNAHRELPEVPEITPSTGEGIAFSAVVHRDGSDMTLVGIRRDFSTSVVASDSNYSQSGFSIIVDSAGRYVTLANGSVSHEVLDRWFNDSVEVEAERIAEAAQSDSWGDPLNVDDVTMSTGDTGYIVSGKCSVNDWILLTFVPETAFAQEAGAIAAYYWVAVLAMVACFVLVVFAVIRSNKRATQDIEDALYIDTLTGGMTPAAFRERAKELIRENQGEPYFMVFLDVRGFKDVSELYGEDAAVKMVVAIHDALHRGMSHDELLARSDRDRFFLLVHAHGPDFLQKRLNVAMRRIRRSAAARYFTGSFDIGAGACRAIDPEGSVPQLEDRAMRAAVYCPPHGKCVFFRRDLEARIERDLILDSTFSDAIKNGDFVVFCQPKICLADEKISSAEALVRWFHPDLGLVSPGEFIPLFERNRKICQLDRYVFVEVCRTLARWNEGELPGVRMSINLSRVSLLECGIDIVSDMRSICDLYKVPTHQIEVEITESLALDEHLAETVSEAISLMHEAGFTVSIDDFGSGYSSLATLKDFEADSVKLDRTFFMGINDRGWRVVGSFMMLAEELGIEVVAEGIEEAYQMDRLRELKCGFVQGFYCARPMSMDDYLEWEKGRLHG